METRYWRVLTALSPARALAGAMTRPQLSPIRITSFLGVLVMHVTVATAQTASPVAFPAAWAGEWRGTMTQTSPPDSVRVRVPVQVTIAPLDGTGRVWRWRELFDNDTTRGLKDYRLLVRDAARGEYATDEMNGIVLEARWLSGVLESVFQVGEQVLASRYLQRGDSLVHELTWWKATPATRTAGAGRNGEQGAAVLSFVVSGRQRSVMTRAKE
ncbi:MAG: hypothetical protein MUF00_17425 [Gemmatimonadaceae bacterium]|jgi:hypothetical protein|nr:hypothetical protein [Gemmatimonadaceae bacterium]